jgi:hypothetical protein
MVQLENLLGYNGMVKTEDYEPEVREPHEVSEEALELYKTINRKVFRTGWHTKTRRIHAKAHTKAQGTLQERVEEREKQKGTLSKFDVQEALTHAMIQYRKEAGIPIGDDENSFRVVYQEIGSMMSNLDKNTKLNMNQLIAEGNYEAILMQLHGAEHGKIVEANKNYLLDKYIPHGKEHNFYVELGKAIQNDIGQKSDKGDLLAQFSTREGITGTLGEIYDNKMDQHLRKAHGKGLKAAANNNAHYKQASQKAA